MTALYFSGHSSGYSSTSSKASSSNSSSSTAAELAAVMPAVPKDLNPNYKPQPSYAAPGLNINGSSLKPMASNGNRMRSEYEELSSLMAKKGTRGQMYSGVKR